MYNPSAIIEGADGVAIAVFQCVSCGRKVEVKVTQEGLRKRAEGRLIQDCFPELDSGTRELFLSGICPRCFDDMFKDEDE